MLRSFACGTWPSIRHDNIPFANSKLVGDKARAERAGEPMRMRGCLVDVRGDWDWYKYLFGVAGWQLGPATKPICYRCACTVGQLHEFGLDASWRRTLRGPREYLELARTTALYTAPLAVPGFSWCMLRPGVMHVACLGVAQDCLGNTFTEVFYELGGTRSHDKEAIAR